MSDSYSKWCEEREEKARMFSEQAFADVRAEPAFKRRLCNAKKLIRSAKVARAKSCANCRYMGFACFPNGQQDIRSCLLLGVKDVREDWCCGKWKPFRFGSKLRIRGLAVDSDVIGYCVIKRK